LGEPTTECQVKALNAFKEKNYQQVKRIALSNLNCYYCKCLSYLGAAYKLTPNTDTIFAEATRAACEVYNQRSNQLIGQWVANVFEKENSDS